MRSVLDLISATTDAPALVRRSSVALDHTLAETPVKQLPSGEPPDGIGTLAGGALGMMLWPGHPVLGLAEGASLGRNVPALFEDATRRTAACNLAQTSAAVAGSYVLGKLPLPWTGTLGFLAGWALAGAALYLVGAEKAESEV